jgi:PAS domain S-box-containing protein
MDDRNGADFGTSPRVETTLADDLFRLAAEAAPGGVLIVSPAGTIVFVNRTLEQQFGYHQHELLGQPVEILLVEALQSIHRGHRLEYSSHPETRSMGAAGELFGRRKDGSQIPIEIGLNAIHTGEGLFVVAFVADVSERRRAGEARERDLHDRIAFERLVGDLSATFVNLKAEHVDAAIAEALRRICEVLDLDRSTLFEASDDTGDLVLTHHWSRLPHPQPPVRFLLQEFFPWTFARLRAGELACFSSLDEIPDPRERETVRHFGTQSRVAFPLSVSGRLIAGIAFASMQKERTWPEETLSRLQLLAQVFAAAIARKQADIALRTSEERFRRLADAAPVLIWVSGPDRLCTWFNRQWLDFVGQTMAHELGNGWAQGVHPDDLDACLETYTAAFDAHRPFAMEYRLRRHDGAWRWIRDTGAPNYAADGTFAGYLGSCLDVTDMKEATLRLEKALAEVTRAEDDTRRAYDELRDTQQSAMEQERLRVLGQMASGIAHDINNALTPVSLYTEVLLESEPGLSDEAREYLRTIQRAADDVGQTLDRLRQFSRRHGPALTLAPVDLNAIAADVRSLTRARWHDIPLSRGTVIEVRLDLSPDLPTVIGVESEIREALTNLVFNAVDAMPSGGTLTLRTRVASAEAADGGATPTVQFEVADTGLGMSEETRRRCFEPFFTTKGERGTGLGLAMVYGIARRHRAAIDIDSVVGTGTTVRLDFPVQPSRLVGPVPTVESAPVSLRLRILVIDDDPVFTKSLRDILERDGHVVVTAAGGGQGIAAFDEAVGGGDRFDVVVTDLGMPHVDGGQVAAAIKGSSPSTPVILLTGWGRQLMESDDVPHVDRVLTKPPKLNELRSTLAWAASPGNRR